MTLNLMTTYIPPKYSEFITSETKTALRGRYMVNKLAVRTNNTYYSITVKRLILWKL